MIVYNSIGIFYFFLQDVESDLMKLEVLNCFIIIIYFISLLKINLCRQVYKL